uniref:Uncharacterized protein n=1 Tax=Ciona intestinalis TaxID=7719 RepID=H2XJZ9_CIOIN
MTTTNYVIFVEADLYFIFMVCYVNFSQATNMVSCAAILKTSVVFYINNIITTVVLNKLTD